MRKREMDRKVIVTSLIILILILSVASFPVCAVNRALNLEQDSAYVKIGGDLGIWKSFTMEAWFNPVDVFGCYVGYEDPGASYGVQLMGDGVERLWHHVAMTYDGKVIRAYVNGVMIGELPSDRANIPLLIGASQDIRGLFFEGLLDEVRIWSVARTQQQVQASMNITLTGQENDLVGYWNFDDGTAKDLSSNGSHAVFYGGAQIIEASPFAQEKTDPIDVDYIWIDLGKENEGFLLTQDDKGDGITEHDVKAGVDCRKVPFPYTGAGHNQIYFGIDDSFLHGGNNEVWIVMEYFDAGTQIDCHYDSNGAGPVNGAFRGSGDGAFSMLKPWNTETWKTHVWHITDGRFENRVHDSDFRFSTSGTSDMWINRVWLLTFKPTIPFDPENPTRRKEAVSLVEQGFQGSGLVLYYTFDTEEKGVIKDLSGTGNDATIRRGPELVDGRIGKAIRFESGDHLVTPDADSLRSDEITVALWVNWSGEDLPNELIGKFAYELGGYLFKMEYGETNMWIYDKAMNNHTYGAIPGITPGEWTHLAVTFDGKHQRGYVNGVKAENGGNVDMPWDGPIGHADGPLMMGSYSGDFSFTGMIDEVAIYNRALTEEEILQTMKNGHISPAINTADGSNVVLINQIGRFVLAMYTRGVSETNPLTEIHITLPNEFQQSGARVVEVVQAGEGIVRAESTQDGRVLKMALDEAITRPCRILVSFEAIAGPAEVSNVAFSVCLLTTEDVMLIDETEGFEGITIISDVPPFPVTNVMARSLAGENDVKITWGASDKRIRKYEIYADGAKIGEVGKKDATSYTHTSAKPGATISYTIAGIVMGEVRSDPSEPASATVGQDSIPPQSPDVQVRRLGLDTVQITWTPISRDTARYIVYRGTSQTDLEQIAAVAWDKSRYVDRTTDSYVYAVDVQDDQGNTAPKPLPIHGKYHTQGSAYWDGNNEYFVLTRSEVGQAGRIFFNKPSEMRNWMAEFEIRMWEGVGIVGGADGMTFAFVRNTGYPAVSGGGLDFGGEGYGVEFDTYPHENDPRGFHIGLLKGYAGNHLTTAMIPEGFGDGVWHRVLIIFTSGQITVYYDGEEVISNYWIPDYNIFTGYFGFTAATGDDYEWHAVRNIHIAQTLKSDHDVMVSAITAPGKMVGPTEPIVPMVRVLNVGTGDEINVPVTCEITALGEVVYSDTQTMEKIASLEIQEMSFARWTPQEGGQYEVRIAAELPGDENKDNDSSTIEVATFLFIDATEAAGLVDETGGECVAVGDYDGDGDVDLYTGRLYRNEGHGIFTDVTDTAGLATIESVIDAAFGDINGDGNLDILVIDGQDVAIYSNSGDGTFDEITPLTGVKREGGARALRLADYDGDGHLDIYLARIGPNRLYHNNGDGTFADVTETAGVGDAGWSEAAVFGDYNGDNALDIYVANWGAANVLYRNNGDGTFTDISDASGTGHPGSAKDVLLCDYDGDGDLDLFVANGGNQPDVLYGNNGDGSFTDVTIDAGLGGQTWTEAVTCGDYDGDGRLDLYLVVSSGANLLYRNNGHGTFSKTQQMAGVDDAGAGAAAAFFDCDGDGDLDLFIANSGQSNALYRNTTRRSAEDNEGR